MLIQDKLDKYALIVSGSTAPKDGDFSEDGLPFVRAGHLEKLCSGAELTQLPKVNDHNAKRLKLVKVPKGTVLFAKSGMSIMKSRIYTTTGDCYIVNHLAGIIPNSKLLARYLQYYFQIHRPSSFVLNDSYPSIRLNDICALKFPLPPLETQKKIAAVLDKAQELIDKRKEQIQKLDKFVQSVFLDMFGDWVRCKQAWKETYLEDLFTIISDCPHSTPTYLETNEGIPCIRTSDLQNGFLDFSTTKFVSEEEYFDRIKRYKPRAGDIIYTREGERFGIAAVIPKDLELCLGQRVMIFSVDKKTVTSEFAWALLNSNYIYLQAKQLVGGSTSPHVNIKDVKKYKAFMPPITLQRRFSEIIENVRQQKILMQQSLTEMENNFNSIMQRAFKGELF